MTLGGVIFIGSLLNVLAKISTPLERFINYSPVTDGPSRTDLNTADLEEFAGLPSVGKVLARKILDYRLEHGSFRDPRELRQIPGIGPLTYERIAPFVTVTAEAP